MYLCHLCMWYIYVNMFVFICIYVQEFTDVCAYTRRNHRSILSVFIYYKLSFFFFEKSSSSYWTWSSPSQGDQMASNTLRSPCLLLSGSDITDVHVLPNFSFHVNVEDPDKDPNSTWPLLSNWAIAPTSFLFVLKCTSWITARSWSHPSH